MTRTRTLVLAAAVACTLSACQPAPSTAEAPARAATPSPGTLPEPMPDTVTATAPPGGLVDAVQVADATSPVGGGAFDARRFAGRYAGGGESIEIMADGRYLAAHAGAAAAKAATAGGTWSIEAKGGHVLLDADDKATPDRLFALAKDGTLREQAGTTVLHRATE